MTGLPTGTVTFLFTDIEGSTRLLSEIGDEAYGGVLERERRIVVDAAAANGGATFGSEGDAHFVAFGSAVRAIRAAVAAQERLAAEPWEHGEVRVRMGIHTGEAQVVGEDYVGLEVHRAARIAAAGHGGQVLVSDATRSLVAGALPETLALRDLGEHRLKDLSRPERLWQVDAPGRPSSFAPLRTVDLTPNNLPPQLTSFVGRAEVAEGVRLLLAGRLLTLTGPGGTGKTRLSLALATEALPAYPGGAWFVPLASVTDPELVPSSIATAVGLLALNRSPLERILEHFGERTALIVLDNFEQVVAAAPIVADLLRGAPRLTVLVSSRAPLRIAGEQEFPVPPLSLPAAGESDPDRLMASEAVRLFLERAMAVRPDFALGADNGAAVAEIVRRLDGLPLAIELAAARVRILSPGAMVARLTDRLGLLSAGGRDLPERQRTLRGAIGWSHDLLDADARRLFARLAVFASGGPLDTVEAVCGSDGGGSADLDVLAGLEALAEQSLLRIGDDAHGDPRFTMLETIREYALERLGELGEGDALRDRHGRAYLELAQAAAGHLHGDDRGPDLDRLEEDHDNLRAAIEDAIARGDCERASGFLSALFRFWHMRGHLVEARSRAAAVLAMDGWGEMPSVARLRALEIAGGLAYWAGDLSDASGHYAAAEAEARRLGDEREIANALYNRFFSSRPTSGLDDWIDALAHENRRFVEEALAIYRRLGDESGLARCLWALGESDMYRRDTEGAERNTTESLEIFERLGDGFGAAYAHFTRGVARQLDGNAAGAGEDFAAALRVFRAAGDVSGISIVLSAMSSTLIAAGRDLEAHRMGGAASRWVAETGTHLATLFPEDWFPAPAAGSPDPELRAAWTTGARLGREESIDEGLRLAESIAGMPRAPA